MDASELPLDYPHRAAATVVRACIVRGGLSPLFMLPWQRDPGAIQATGFDEFGVFGLVMEEFGPDDPKVVISEAGNAKVGVDNLGVVTFARRMPRASNLVVFHDVARQIMQLTGPEPDAFAETTCCRFYGEYLESVRQNMGQPGRKDQLKQKLVDLYNDTLACGVRTFCGQRQSSGSLFHWRW